MTQGVNCRYFTASAPTLQDAAGRADDCCAAKTAAEYLPNGSPYDLQSKPVNLIRKNKGNLRSHRQAAACLEDPADWAAMTDDQHDCRRTTPESEA
jgi:hypothetical protein